MTKAFLEPMIIKTESEKLIVDAFSQKNLKEIKVHNDTKRINLNKFIKEYYL